jgi:hypothetical protein
MSQRIAPQVPPSNLEIYSLVYVIEVAIRELIIERLAKQYGPKWYLEAIPRGSGGQKDGREVLSMLDKYLRGDKSARSAPWAENIPHHPIYYLDFPELAIILEKKSNWGAFQDIFGRKEIALSSLRELEPIRNKVAHNRKASESDLRVVTGAYEKLSMAIGRGRMAELAGRCSNAEELPALLLALSREAERAHESCVGYAPLEPLETWRAVAGVWWFDSAYLQHDIGPIETYFRALQDYSSLPRARGTGHIIERWVKAEQVEDKYNAARAAFHGLLETFKDA